MKTRALYFILTISMMLSNNIRAQEVTAFAQLDTTDILIGDQIRLNLEFTMPLDYRVIWPFYQDTLTQNVEIIGQTAVDTIIHELDNLVNMIQSITITSFDSGYYRIAPLKFYFQPIDDTAFTEITTAAVYLRVHTMEVDTSQAIKAIKPPLTAPLTFREVLPWILIALAATLIVLLVIYVVRKRKKSEPLFRIRPKIILPAHVVAMNELEILKLKKLWQSGKVKNYYTELTDIVRIYIENRFDVRAVEMTTYEIMEGMKQADANKEIIEKLRQTLMLADLVKFARENPQALENDTSMNNSMEFVRDTIQEIETSIKDTEEDSPDADNEGSNKK
jgi:hypothetical protein